MRWKIGTDPELFFLKQGVPTSAHDILPGTKRDPHRVPMGAVQVDGVAAEFNIDPADDVDTFTTNIKTVLRAMKELSPGVDFSFQPIAHFPEDYFFSLPPEAKELGCDPDYNAYTSRVNKKPQGDRPNEDGQIMRTGAGHIHVGWMEGAPTERGSPHFLQCCKVTRQLDCVLLPASLSFGDDIARRTLYGEPGTFRPKSYGVEYRSLSNLWVNYEESVRWVFEATTASLDLLLDKTNLEKPFRKLIPLKKMTPPAFNYMQALFEEYGIPPVPEQLTRLEY